jgi:hypothetical protein
MFKELTLCQGGRDDPGPGGRTHSPRGPRLIPPAVMCLDGGMDRTQRGFMAAAIAALVLVSCGGGDSPPKLTCSASCTEYRWNFEVGSGNAEWCTAPLPKSGGVSQCVSRSTDMQPPLNCSMMSLSQKVSTCTGTIKSLDSGREWTVTTTVDPATCTLTVTVDGAGTCTAP